MRKLIKNLFFLLNVAVVIMTLFAFISSEVSPAYTTMLSYFSLLFPVLLFFNIGFIFFWLILLNWRFLISLLILIAGHQEVKRTFSFSKEEHSPAKHQVTVLDYNIKEFSRYEEEWKRDSIATLIREWDPDIVAFQEFFARNVEGMENLSKVQKKSGYPFKIVDSFQHHWVRQYYSNVILSRFPIVNSGTITFRDNMINRCIFADMVIDNDTFRYYNVHFQSIGVASENLSKYGKERSEQIKNQVQKINYAFRERVSQVMKVSDHIKTSPYPVILSGDFNDTPLSFTYSVIDKILQDAWLRKGEGFGFTFAGNLPFLRIDYIFSSPEFVIHDIRVIHKGFSDHYPLFAKLGFGKVD